MKISSKSTRETIHEALVDAFNSSQRPVTRETLHFVTGISKATIDEHLDKLITVEETVIRVERGLFEPVIKHPETRPISKTVIPGGLIKLEIGDKCIDMTPSENRIMKELFGGRNDFHEAEAMQQSRVLMAQMATNLVTAARETRALRERVLVLEGKKTQMALGLEA
jgi:hypothetical protein